jgi:hypothetical protein
MDAAAPVAREGHVRHAPGTCLTCRHFAGSAREIEERLPGLPALGSVYGSVRSADGLCRLRDRYLAASSSCASHEARGRTGAHR